MLLLWLTADVVMAVVVCAVAAAAQIYVRGLLEHLTARMQALAAQLDEARTTTSNNPRVSTTTTASQPASQPTRSLARSLVLLNAPPACLPAHSTALAPALRRRLAAAVAVVAAVA